MATNIKTALSKENVLVMAFNTIQTLIFILSNLIYIEFLMQN